MTGTQKTLWIGRGLSLLAMVPFFPSVMMKFTMNPQVIEGMGRYGFQQSSIMTLAILELLSMILYLVPKTSVLGAILVTGYLGGAICTHFRMGENVVMQVAIGIVVWAALYLQDTRLRQLLPLRS